MPTGVDHDLDGDYDHFDALHQSLIDNPEIALGQAAEERADYLSDNMIWEFFEDIGELFDSNPNNDSFVDGGNGSGNETPTHQSILPAQGPYQFPVQLDFDGVGYSFLNGNFTIQGGGGPGGGGGDGIFGV